MKIYYLMVEAVPKDSNDEKDEFGGAYVNCWVKEDSEEMAILKAREYIDEEGWELLRIENSFLAQRDLYIEEKDSLECYDLACKYGIGAIFYTYPIEG